MNRNDLSHTIYRDRNIHGQTPATMRGISWSQLRAEDSRAEGFEVLLRLLLIVCVGAGMLACGVNTSVSTPAMNDAAQCAPVAVTPARVAAKAASSLLPKAMVRVVSDLR